MEYAIFNLLVVIVFNMSWMVDGKEHFISLYNGEYSNWSSLCFWIYAIWGFLNLLYILTYFVLCNLIN